MGGVRKDEEFGRSDRTVSCRSIYQEMTFGPRLEPELMAKMDLMSKQQQGEEAVKNFVARMQAIYAEKWKAMRK